MPPSLREYDRAEARIRQSIELRCGGFPAHTYEGRDEDLATLRAFHAEHGIPPSGFFARLLWRLRGAS
jgi:hypothetical protein